MLRAVLRPALRGSMTAGSASGFSSSLAPSLRFASDKFKLNPHFEALTVFTEQGMVNVGFHPFADGKRGSVAVALRVVANNKVDKSQDVFAVVQPWDAMGLHYLWSQTLASGEGFTHTVTTSRAKGKAIIFEKEKGTGQVTLTWEENGVKGQSHVASAPDFHGVMMAVQAYLPHMLGTHPDDN